MLKIITILSLIISFVIFDFFARNSFALSIDDAIDLGVSNSLELQIENKKTEYTALSKYEALTDFLPNASLNYRDGNRRTEINSLRDKQKDEVKTLNISQKLFNGFSGVSKFQESLYKTKSAEQNLKHQKNEIALRVAQSYFNILKYKKLLELSEIQKENYKKLITLADKKLSLKDISYDEFCGYVLKAKKNGIEFNQHKIELTSHKATFNHLTNHDSEGLVFPELSEISNLGNNNEISNFVATAISQNPKIKSASYASQAKKSAVLAESGKLLPTISLNYQAENQKSSFYFNGQEIQNKTVYLNFSIPIFQSGVEYTSISKANKERQIANLEKKLSIKEIQRDAIEHHRKFLYLKENFISSLSAFEASKKALNLAKSRFNKKDIGLMDYLILEIDNIEIHKQMISLKSDYVISYYNLKSLIDEINPKE